MALGKFILLLPDRKIGTINDDRACSAKAPPLVLWEHPKARFCFLVGPTFLGSRCHAAMIPNLIHAKNRRTHRDTSPSIG